MTPREDDLTSTRDRVTRVEASLDGVRGAVESLHVTVRDLAEAAATYHRQAFEEVRALRSDLVRIHERIDERHDEAIKQAAHTADHARSIEWLRQREAAREKRAENIKAWALRSLWAGVAAVATWALGQVQWRLWP